MLVWTEVFSETWHSTFIADGLHFSLTSLPWRRLPWQSFASGGHPFLQGRSTQESQPRKQSRKGKNTEFKCLTQATHREWVSKSLPLHDSGLSHIGPDIQSPPSLLGFSASFQFRCLLEHLTLKHRGITRRTIKISVP